MSFQNLEDHVAKEDVLDDFFTLFKPSGGLREPTRTVLGYALDIGALLDTIQLQEEYAFHGGYASLVHLMALLGPPIALTWRGSTDIDMYGTQEVITTLKRAYHVESDRKSPNLAKKRTIKLTTLQGQAEPETKIDFTFGPPEEETVQRHILGVPLQVVTPTTLIKNKIPLSKDDKHRVDIINMLWVLENEGVTPAQVCKLFSPHEKQVLYHLIQSTKGVSTNQRMSLAPSTLYVNTLAHGLRKYNHNL